MNLSLSDHEADLVRYACNHMEFQALEKAIDVRKGKPSWAEAIEKDAREYSNIARRISELQQNKQIL